MLQQAEHIEPSSADELAMEKEYKHVSSLAEKVLGLSQEYQCPPYPKSYEVLYTYFAGSNPKLNELTDSLISKNGHLTREDLNKIYEEILDEHGRFEDVQLETGQKLTSELDEISALVEKYMNANSDYCSSLNDSVKDLESVNTANDLKGMVSNLIRENENMRDQTMEMTRSLEASKGQIYDLKMCLTAAIEDSMKDPLTELGNRRWLERSISKVLTTRKISVEHHCIALIDLDHFKNINDTFGHVVGDKVLRYFGNILGQSVTGDDTSARYGGEEFAILFLDRKLDDACEFLEGIRKKLEASNLVLSNTKKPIGTITASFGVTRITPEDTMEKLLDRADAQLYLAKNRGRNQVVSG